MAASKEIFITPALTAKEATQTITVGDALEGTGTLVEILKSPHTSRPKKDKQAIIPIHMSSRNLLCTQLTMEEKGKAVTMEIDEEEIDLEELMMVEEEGEGMEEKAELTPISIKFPAYVPQRKGKAKVPKDLDETKSSL